ncbi:MAG: insulinase family protein [Phycisphaerae bacterium]|nr:insulinase family protein [Phycisphaerae bacterium]
MEFKEAQLDNGLKIIAEVNPDAASMAAGFFTRTGSRDETPKISGVSHFLEHMVFKGTERRTPLDVNLEYDRMGAQYNAFTSEENTVYYAAVLPEFQNSVLDLLCDIMRPALRQEDFDIEKGVIHEEIAMYQDHPQFCVYDNLMTLYFAPHPLGNEILGSVDSIANLTRDEMQDYFDRRYSPTNVTMVGVGNLDFDAFVAKTAAMCNHWKPFTAERKVEPWSGTGKSQVMTDSKLMRQHLGLMSAAPSCQDDTRFIAQVMATIVGDTTGSRLYYALVETALADEAHMTYSPMDGTGSMLTFISTDPAKTAQVRDIAAGELKKFCEEGPTENELTAAKNKIASGATIKGELPMSRLTAVGFDWVYRNEYIPMQQQIDEIYSVTTEQVLELGRSIKLDKTTTLTLGPLESLD